MSLLARMSPACAIRLAVTGAPAGMSTRAPLPLTSLMAEKAWGGAGLKLANVRSEAEMTVRALMSWLATTILMPADPPRGKGQRAMAAGAAKGRGARAAPGEVVRGAGGGGGGGEGGSGGLFFG